ncbi:hypothetical protein GCM10028819_09170 [Spirosoma humi]
MSLSTYGQCDQLVRAASKESDRVVVTTTQVGKPSTEPIQYRRVQQKGQTRFFLQLYTAGGSALPQKGATVFFTDGSSIQWPNVAVTSWLNEAGHTSHCLIKLVENEIEQFQDKTVASLTLFTHKRLVTVQQAQRAKNLINCVIGADLIDIKSDQLVRHQ